MLHLHRKIASYFKGFGLFGLTYCFAAVTSLLSVLHFIYGAELGGAQMPFLCISRKFSEQTNELNFTSLKKADTVGVIK